MKIKTDFVTNSSSTSYIVSLPKKISVKELRRIANPGEFERFQTIKTIRQLITYTQNQKYDWLNDITGPRRYWTMDEADYKKWRDYLKYNKDRYIVLISIDRDDEKRKQKVEKYVTLYETRGIIEEKEYT